MCVLCKQLRRKHGSTGALPPGLVSSLAQDGRVRSGKSAFVRAVPMLLSLGPVRHAHAKLPHSRAWTPSEWAAERKGGPECGGSDDDEDEEDAGVEPAEVVTERKPIIFTTGVTAPSVMDAPIVPVDTVGSPTTTEPENPLPTSNAAKRSGMSQAERLRLSQKTERTAITFGKSGIHGWGLFARAPLAAGTIVIEYRGEAMRAATSEWKERAYNERGTDCYLFTVIEDRVVDSTKAGTIARFTNHSCSPSMYSRILEVDKMPRLVFMTRGAVQAGQELTYDYRFKEEAGDNKMHCRCGAPNCRGSLN